VQANAIVGAALTGGRGSRRTGLADGRNFQCSDRQEPLPPQNRAPAFWIISLSCTQPTERQPSPPSAVIRHRFQNR